MHRTAPITLAAALLLGVSLIVATVGRADLLEACVCVVNALSRGMLALGLTLLLGMAGLLPVQAEGSSLLKAAHVVQLLSFAIALFFLIQYAYYLLEVIR